jgi:DNA-binding NtrC family response regulator
MNETQSTARKITLTSTGEVYVDPEGNTQSLPQRRVALLIFCDAESQVVPLSEGAPVVVGRGTPSEIVVSDNSISLQHARFVLQDGRISVTDLDSRNGTFLRGSRIREAELDAGDELQMGRARVIVAATARTEALAGEEPVASADDLVVESDKMKQLYRDAARAAPAELPVLILGETGAGKEHVAIAIHREGPRREKPFVVVNCAAIPPGLLESTLFGHERGAFTGAAGRAIGMFERAHGGILFLDEIGELPIGAQAALLRAIETGRIYRVGASTEVAIDARIVAATHCDLEAMVEDGSFRRDLFYRLSGVVLKVPPLRERPEEIAALSRYFLAKARREWRTSAPTLTADALRALESYSWPGNVRQLRHAVERAALLGGDGAISSAQLPDYVTLTLPGPGGEQSPKKHSIELALREQLQRYERSLIEDALRRAAGNRQVAAKLLRIPLRTLFRRIQACGVADDADREKTTGGDSPAIETRGDFCRS